MNNDEYFAFKTLPSLLEPKDTVKIHHVHDPIDGFRIEYYGNSKLV